MDRKYSDLSTLLGDNAEAEWDIKMDRKYGDLNALLKDNAEAVAYFNKLPEYVKEMIQQRAQGVNSFESLCHYAEKLTQGDH
ncbi:MAG: hypothetical protein RR461_00890 [Angelakisella sp.]